MVQIWGPLAPASSQFCQLDKTLANAQRWLNQISTGNRHKLRLIDTNEPFAGIVAERKPHGRHPASRGASYRINQFPVLLAKPRRGSWRTPRRLLGAVQASSQIATRCHHRPASQCAAQSLCAGQGTHWPRAQQIRTGRNQKGSGFRREYSRVYACQHRVCLPLSTCWRSSCAPHGGVFRTDNRHFHRHSRIGHMVAVGTDLLHSPGQPHSQSGQDRAPGQSAPQLARRHNRYSNRCSRDSDHGIHIRANGALPGSSGLISAGYQRATTGPTDLAQPAHDTARVDGVADGYGRIDTPAGSRGKRKMATVRRCHACKPARTICGRSVLAAKRCGRIGATDRGTKLRTNSETAVGGRTDKRTIR